MKSLSQASTMVYKAILSCRTEAHLATADNLIDNYVRLHGEIATLMPFHRDLCRELQVKRIEIMHLQTPIQHE